jgi:arginyl-tRNA synthetase
VKEHLEELLSQSLLHLQREGVLPADALLPVQLERTRSPEHGEFASNLAMVLAKSAGMPPRKLAEAIISRVPMSRQVDRMEIAGPGFINIFLQRCALTGVAGGTASRSSMSRPTRPDRCTSATVAVRPTAPASPAS